MAQSLNTPDVLTQPIATNGTKNSIPNTNDQSLGLMSQSTGFPPICSERIADGGKAPRRADFNGAFNLVTQQHFFFQNGGTETFRQDVSDAIGGYPLNARLWYTDSNNESVIVRSLIQNNTYNFNTTPSYIDGIHWVVDVESGAPVGAVMPYAGSTPPDGWLVCDGSEISRTNYARLFSVIGTTYGAGDGNSSFNIPNLNNRNPFMFSNKTSHPIGTTYSGYLPNITGGHRSGLTNLSGETGASGAFAGQTTTGASYGYSSGGQRFMTVNFDASMSSGLYGRNSNEFGDSVVARSLSMSYAIKF